jgi:lipoprotein-anchoring transpeptidase ErfK/SrfK
MKTLMTLTAALCVALSLTTTTAEARKRHKPAALAEPTLNINIDISSQTMSVRSNGSAVASYKVSTARAGFWTPRGHWRVQRMARVHYSKQFNNYPLPHAIFFVGGVAIHATKGVAKLGTPASHGCVRLAPENAARLYAMVANHGMKKTLVTVTN